MNRYAAVAIPVLIFITACNAGGDVTVPGGLPADADTAAEVITASALLETVTGIASDEMMGRGPGIEGDRLAKAYLAQRLEAAGYAPAFGKNGYEQPMSMVGVTTELPEEWAFRNAAGREISLHRADEFIGGSGVQQPAAVLDNAELVFVGYGITASEQDWDDYMGADLDGKILLMLNDDPDWDPELFAGERRLYYGRWNYKYEIAAEQERYVTSESAPRSGWYYRSDQFSFASIGVPAIWFKSGTDFIDRPEGWGEKHHADWIEHNYHRPYDQVEDSWVLDGLVEDTHLGFRLALTVATADEMPSWYPGDEFEDERFAALAE